MLIFAVVGCTEINGEFKNDQRADFISIFYDVGGIVGECKFKAYNGVLVFYEIHATNFDENSKY